MSASFTPCELRCRRRTIRCIADAVYSCYCSLHFAATASELIILSSTSTSRTGNIVRARPWTMVGVYALLVGLPALLVVGALGLGERLPAATGPVPVDLPGGTGTASFDLALLILQIVVIVAV